MVSFEANGFFSVQEMLYKSDLHTIEQVELPGYLCRKRWEDFISKTSRYGKQVNVPCVWTIG